MRNTNQRVKYLDSKGEIRNTGMGEVWSVSFSPDGFRIVGGGLAPDNSSWLKVWDAGVSDTLEPLAKPDRLCACGSIPGAQGREAERAQQLGDVRGLLARRQDHRVGLERQDDQSLGCRCVGTDTPSNP